MVEEHKAARDMLPAFLHRFTVFLFVLLLTGGAVWAFMFYFVRCLDGCGPYRVIATASDLDGDGDLDVVLSSLRHESDSIVWAGASFWINEGGGKFSNPEESIGGHYATVADVDGDGDVDVVSMAGSNEVELYLNEGGVQGRTPGEFRIWHSIIREGELWDFGSHGVVLLGDLNNDHRLDAFVGDCCGLLWKERGKEATYIPSLAWVWINTPDEKGRPVGLVVSLTDLGDLPMSPALGDLDGDGDLDVFAAIRPPNHIGSYLSADRVLFNDGNANFTDSGQRLAIAGGLQASIERLTASGASRTDGSTAVALGDLDGDGDLDALAGRPTGAIVWTNQGRAQGGREGVFAESDQFLPGRLTEEVFLADLDMDGDLDALIAGKEQASIWWNDRQGRFSDSGLRLEYTERHGLALGDFDGDGDLDVFIARASGDFHLWLNQGNGTLRVDNEPS